MATLSCSKILFGCGQRPSWDSERLMLTFQRLFVAVVSERVALAALALEHHGEGASVTRRRTVRICPVNRLAVMGYDVAWT
jgi:hypothetical protein